MAVAVVWQDPITGKTGYTALSTDTLPNCAAGSQAWITDQPGRVDEYDGASWITKSINGQTYVNVRNTTSIPVDVGADSLYTPLIGSATTFVALPSGAGKGPDTYVVDLDLFSSTDIYLVVLSATGTIQVTASVQYSQDGVQSARLLHPETADVLINAAAGNNQAVVPKKDRFAHITLSQGAGAAENVWAYVVGRVLA